MSDNNTQLPAEVLSKIKRESFDLYPDKDQGPFRIGYQDGATEWAQWKVKADQWEGANLTLQMEHMLLKQQYQQLKERSDKMEAGLKEIAESSCDYESTNWAKALHSPECRACKAKEILAWKGKEVKPEKPIEPTLDLGICKECKTRPAVIDYNGHQHFVCKLCDDSLNRAFDNEYQ